MGNCKTGTGDADIRRITCIGMWINIALAVFKGIVGAVTGSLALVADAVHSLSDMVTDIAVLLGIHFGSREPDPEHPYGHGRMETFSAAFVAIALMAVGVFMIQQASAAIVGIHTGRIMPARIGTISFIAAGLSVVLKELLYQWTRSVAVKTHSSAVYANAWHHRSDALSSVAVLIGFAAIKFGYEHGDQVAAIVVALMIMFVAAGVLRDCLGEFAERAVDEKVVEQIELVIKSENRIRQWHRLRTRSVGRQIFLDLHILVDPRLNITDAHAITEALEESIKSHLTRPVNIVIHVEPDVPELRR